jgi:hypothetical protein
MIGTFEKVLDSLNRRNHHTCWLLEASTGNYYRAKSLQGSLQKQPNEPGYNPGLRFAEVEYVDRVYQGCQGFISWVVPPGWTPQTGQPAIPANPGQRLLLYTVVTVQNWVPSGDYWRPDRVNGLRQ